MFPQQIYGGDQTYYQTPFYNSCYYQPWYFTSYGYWPYYGTPYMSNVPNFEPNRSMDKRPQELKFKPCMIKDRDPVEFSGWRPKQICCGTIFIGPQGQFLLDPKYIRLHTGKCMYLTLYDDICQSVNKTVIPYDERDSDIRFGAPESSKSSHTSFDGGLEKQSSEADNSLLSGSTQIESSGLSSRNLRPRKRTMMI